MGWGPTEKGEITSEVGRGSSQGSGRIEGDQPSITYDRDMGIDGMLNLLMQRLIL